MACRLLADDRGAPLIQQGEPQTREFEGIIHTGCGCTSCGLVFFEVPPDEVLHKYYSVTYPAASRSWYNIDIDYGETRVSSRTERMIAIAGRFGFGQEHYFHEFGCSFGGLVHGLRRLGYRATGTELNADSVAQARERGNAGVFAEDDVAFLKRTGTHPNVVHGSHVLEHLPNPASYLRELIPCMDEETIVVLLVPNGMALFPTVYGFGRYEWFAYPDHLNLLTPRSALCLARSAGYELLEISTSPSLLQPDATSRALGGATDAPVPLFVREHLVTTAMMDEELAIVLTPAGSPVARRYAASVAAATSRAEANEAFEVGLRRLGEKQPLSDPDPPALPSLPAPVEKIPDLVPLMQALIADAAEARARAAQALEDARSALREIETSTAWQATALPRRLASFLKRRR